MKKIILIILMIISPLFSSAEARPKKQLKGSYSELMPGDVVESEILQIAYNSDSELETVAYNFLYIPYKFGGISRKGIDCSAFVQQVFKKLNILLPRTAREQFKIGYKVTKDQLQKGDLLFFKTYAKFASHVGIYLGNGRMIHASSRSKKVVITYFNYPFYQKRFLGARRVHQNLLASL